MSSTNADMLLLGKTLDFLGHSPKSNFFFHFVQNVGFFLMKTSNFCQSEVHKLFILREPLVHLKCCRLTNLCQWFGIAYIVCVFEIDKSCKFSLEKKPTFWKKDKILKKKQKQEQNKKNN